MRTTPRIVLLAAAGLMHGCGGPRGAFEGRVFPATRAIATQDIHLIRRETMVSLTNTTERGFGAGTVWINRQFAMPIGGLEIGETLSLSLAEFRNEFGEGFRAGGFFATEPADRIVQAHIETEVGLVGLIVVGER